MAVSPKCATLAEEWKTAAEGELASAQTLRATGQNWPQVYWHAGFAVELMLKAIRIRQNGLEEWPPGDRGRKWHDLAFTVDMAGLTEDLRAACRVNLRFEAYWLTVKDWDHQNRYPGGATTSVEARDMLLAVENRTNGVMRWLRQVYQNI
jgi:hypothetical protein